MFDCPHCHEKGITLWEKMWSGSDTPAACSNCNQLSYAHSKYRFGMRSAWPTLVTWFGAAISIYVLYITNIVDVLLLIPVIWVICYIWEVVSLPLTPITKSESTQLRQYGNLFLAVLLLAVLGAWSVGHL